MRGTVWRSPGAALAACVLLAACSSGTDSDPNDRKQVARGDKLYQQHCGACHGANLEGQPNWRERRPDGRLPAPPHDASGHTWHHADEALFDVVKRGIKPQVSPDYQSDMPAFEGVLSDDEIHAVLAYIKSRWPEPIREKQAKISAARRGGK